jgi:hypothetical protein
VVDENGAPLPVYHGTNAEFDVFNGKSFFFGELPEHLASTYGAEKAFFLNIKNLLDLRLEDEEIVKNHVLLGFDGPSNRGQTGGETSLPAVRAPGHRRNSWRTRSDEQECAGV